ncbi:tripartite tricarboxylate transporter permease [Sediminibacillus halophilus]|uniref:Putative tricarboxylic transport membrane protein n=1 Tax=Sediminibacillus halophilus TaxID=482461 RepID=A0A1G9M5Q6_9BACI|nr:tripartite tricarboxylate transporter permease [Sediminibacillus halophilus]SDL69590.1 putative tricarboxylic transport membrane protein [Sediminibacillus halophilus]
MAFIGEIFELHHLVFLAAGLLTGIIVGALPGLTPTMGVALTIPFTFTLGPTEGLILLGGIYCGSVFGGSIPAILFNVPGAPASVATTFDGYPMAQKGQGRKALELTTISSVIGGLFGMILLVFFAPIFADISLQFGPAQTFWVAVFGITAIAAISDGTVTKNLIGGCIGIGLAFVGIHTVTGVSRFTFGIDSFVGGFHIVAVLIGLFAFPQAFRLIENLSLPDKRAISPLQMKGSTIRQSFKDVLLRPKSVLIGSGLGSFIGMIPGAGGNIASILAYNEVKRFSKNKSRFGKGEKKGIIASESANNAMVGGSLIPLLTLGIPGSPTAAIFLGGLLIHGIWPGRNLFVEHADVAYTFLFSMVAAQVLLLFLGLALIKYMTSLSLIPAFLMAPVILSFSIIGSYTTQNSVFDVYTAVVIGCMMFFLHKFQFSAAPIALGFILGSIAEEGLLTGIQVGNAEGGAWHYFFSGPWNLALVLLITGTIVAAFYQGISNYRKKKRSDGKAGTVRQLPHRITWISAAVICLLMVGLLNNLQFELRLMPQITLIILSFLALLESLQKNKTMVIGATILPKKILPLMLLILFILFSVQIIGFYLQVLLLMLLIPGFAIKKGWQTFSYKQLLAITVFFTGVLYLIFSLIFQVPLPALG